jgi:RNA polymerase sigma factor (sigma-70 family)
MTSAFRAAGAPGEAAPRSSAIERVLARFREAALRAAAARGLSGADLDEVLQDVRIRLWRAGATDGKLETMSSAYVYRAATSAALDLLRRRRARHESEMDELPSDAAPHDLAVPGPDGGLHAAETARAVGEALDGLVPNRRAVVRMYLAGYEREEIGALLRWSEAKTRNLLYRGLDDLRRRLTEMGIGPGGAR